MALHLRLKRVMDNGHCWSLTSTFSARSGHFVTLLLLTKSDDWIYRGANDGKESGPTP